MLTPIQQKELIDNFPVYWQHYEKQLLKRFLTEVHSQGIPHIIYYRYFSQLEEILSDSCDEVHRSVRLETTKIKSSSDLVRVIDIRFNRDIENSYQGLLSACTCVFLKDNEVI